MVQINEDFVLWVRSVDKDTSVLFPSTRTDTEQKDHRTKDTEQTDRPLVNNILYVRLFMWHIICEISYVTDTMYYCS